jgi:hypothetical protein
MGKIIIFVCIRLQKIGKIADTTYCTLLKQARENILKIQVLNVPSDVNNYFEYIDETKNIHFRALWNPTHDNKGNKEFKALFLQLQASVEEASR